MMSPEVRSSPQGTRPLVADECTPNMKIWVDADACPVAIREILFRAAERTGVTVTLIANQPVRVPASPHIEFVQVGPGFDVADNEIVKRARSGDLVVTADIPLAAEVMESGVHALNPHGELYSTETIRQRLNMRDFMDTLRGSGDIHRRTACGEQERPAVVRQPSGQDTDQVRERLSGPPGSSRRWVNRCLGSGFCHGTPGSGRVSRTTFLPPSMSTYTWRRFPAKVRPEILPSSARMMWRARLISRFLACRLTAVKNSAGK